MIRRLFVLIVICLIACNLPAAGNKKARATRRAKARKAKLATRQALEVKDVKVSVGTCESLRMAVDDLIKTFGSQYPDGKKYLSRLDVLQARMQKDAESTALQEEFITLQRQALTANPLLDFDRVLLVKRELGKNARSAAGGALGLPTLNARTNDTIGKPGTGWNDSVVEMSDLDGDCVLRTVYKGVHGQIVCDMDLHFDGRRIMFSSGNEQNQWNLYECTEGDPQAVQLTPKDTPDVSYYDSCYLPDGRIATTSTACYQGLPCQNGNLPMASLYLLDGPAGGIRQLTFEQDSDWCPTVLNDGRLMYLRWEYTDAPHYFTRVLFTCNPDGTGQLAYYGSNSYFPNAFFYARPIPDHPTRVVGIVGGHHGVSRAGRLLIIDPAKSRFEADGVVQEIPGRGKVVKPLIIDRLVDGVWPQFLHPYPLSEEYHLVSMKKTPGSLWGVYLVDVFDNLVLLKELEGAALLEPIPYRKRPAPPVIPDRIDTRTKDALVYIADIYHGPGLKGVPRGKVRNLRLFSYHYAHVNSGGHASVGVESSWDVKRVLGTVPVESDGSAFFVVPANTPISLQPLDEKGRALQLMRSWLVGMPGETVSCVGCHENPSTVPPSKPTIAALRQASRISDWYGPRRPFSFVHEVQPVLTKYCAACHNGQPRADGKMIADFSGKIKMPENVTAKDKKFHTTGHLKDVSYMAIQPYVRRPGPESDYHLNKPMEYHASTSELIQMLEKGHHNVKLDDEAWARLVTWIDLNAPHRGSWNPAEWRGHDQQARRLQLAKAYANIDTDPEREYALLEAAAKERKPCTPVVPEPLAEYCGPTLRLAGWPLTGEQAAGKTAVESITLDKEADKPVELKFVMIPAGEFVMGSIDGDLDERPPHVTKIDKPFAMSTTEITNRMYSLFDSTHDSGVIDRAGKDHKDPGEPANRPEQPVIRVTWQEAMAFCRWLSNKTGKKVTLPTESQWEWACRAGTDTAMWYGAAEANFAGFANFADASLSGKVNPIPKSRFRDGIKHTVSTGFGKPNAWGLLDMHGNVAEWTRTDYRPYPYDEHDGRNDLAPSTKKVVRGGSWRDRPQRGRSAFRLAYETWQPVLNVGFRVVIEGKPRNMVEIDNAGPAGILLPSAAEQRDGLPAD